MRRRWVGWKIALTSVSLTVSLVAFASLRAQTTLELSVSSSTSVPFFSTLAPNAPERRDGWFFATSRPSFFGGFVPRAVPTTKPTQELNVDDEFPLVEPQEETRNAEAELSPSYSLWAKFPVGSWARWRATSVVQEKDRAVQSVTETRVLLKNVDFNARRYELTYERVVKLGGVDYSRSSETVVYNFLDVPCDDSTVVEPLESTNLIVAGKAIPCRSLSVSRSDDQRREKTIIWFSPVVAPFVLQKETTRESTNEESAISTRELFVVQKTAANTLLGLVPSSYSTRASSTSDRRKSSTSSVYSPNTPGGLIRETTVEIDSNGQSGSLQTTTVLLDYYVAR